MPSKRSPRAALIDIAENIRYAQEFVAGMTFDAFCEDQRSIYAVTRCLEIISEASRRLPDDMKAQYPHIPWSDIVGAGNIYRHGYDAVEESILWHTVQHSLSPLLQIVDAEIVRLSEA